MTKPKSVTASGAVSDRHVRRAHMVYDAFRRALPVAAELLRHREVGDGAQYVGQRKPMLRVSSFQATGSRRRRHG